MKTTKQQWVSENPFFFVFGMMWVGIAGAAAVMGVMYIIATLAVIL